MDHKNVTTRLTVKSVARGEVEAVFSQFNVIDHDGDVTLPGAFTDGAPVRISAYGHSSWGGELPVGKGRIKTTSTDARLVGRFFMNTLGGRETFETIREMGDLGEWSYGFKVLESEPGQFDGEAVRFLKRLEVHEISPVMLGAGIDTRTVVAKCTDCGAAVGAAPTKTTHADAVQLYRRFVLTSAKVSCAIAQLVLDESAVIPLDTSIVEEAAPEYVEAAKFFVGYAAPFKNHIRPPTVSFFANREGASKRIMGRAQLGVNAIAVAVDLNATELFLTCAHETAHAEGVVSDNEAAGFANQLLWKFRNRPGGSGGPV